VIPGFNLLLEKKQKKKDIVKIIKRMSSVMAFFNSSNYELDSKTKHLSTRSLLGRGIATHQPDAMKLWQEASNKKISTRNIVRLASTKELSSKK
tara:strand:+ start:234 stop:515 length:282 start_codon:yes stop_codon:yes gene_type:complete